MDAFCVERWQSTLIITLVTMKNDLVSPYNVQIEWVVVLYTVNPQNTGFSPMAQQGWQVLCDTIYLPITTTIQTLKKANPSSMGDSYLLKRGEWYKGSLQFITITRYLLGKCFKQQRKHSKRVYGTNEKEEKGHGQRKKTKRAWGMQKLW